MAGTRENARCSSSRCARYTFPVDGPRRTAATFRFLFSSPSSLASCGPSPSSESRGEPVRARAGHGPSNSGRHLLFFALHPFSRPGSPFASLLVRSAALLLRRSGLFLPPSAACLLWVFSLTAASAPLFFRPGRPRPSPPSPAQD